MHIEDQKKLTDNKGWKFVKDYATEKKKEIKDKVTNIVEGIKATPKVIKRSFKKD